MRKAISYLRFSSSKQSSNDSYRRQIEATEKFCKDNGLALSNRLEDLGISAWNKKNLGDDAALGAFLKLVESKEIPRGSVLICENLDRLSRAKILDAMHLFTSIIKHGIDIVTTMDNKWYSEKSISENPTDLMVSIIYLTRGNNESETKSLRLKASWQNRHLKIANKEFARVHCPSWITKKDNRYVLIKENAAKVKLIFDLYLKGYGANMVIQELIKRGVQSFTKTKKWNLVFIHELLQNPAVIGTYENVGLSIKDYYPRCVSDDTYYKALAQRKANNHFLSRTDTKKELNLFAGLCKCHKCGGSVILYSCTGGKHSKKDKRYKFLICTNARIGQCDYIFAPYEKFNDSFLYVLNTANFAKILFSGQPETKDKTPAIRGKIIEIEKTIERVTDAVIKSDSPALVSKLTALEVERKRLERDLADAITANMSKTDVKEDYQYLMDKLNNGLKSNEFRLSLRNLMRKHIESIIVKKDSYVVHFKGTKETLRLHLNENDFEVAYWDSEVEIYDYFSFKDASHHPKDAVSYKRKSESY